MLGIWTSNGAIAIPLATSPTTSNDYTALYTQEGTRLKLVASKPGKNQNIILVPGGPGMDASYLMNLVKLLNVEGNIWLLDLPGNGNNTSKPADFKSWPGAFVKAVGSLNNVILVGHSFGACLILSTPGIEQRVKALILLDGAPRNNVDAVNREKTKFNLPDTVPLLANYQKNPSNKSMKEMLLKMVDYYFPASSKDEGKKMLSEVIVNRKSVEWSWAHFWPTYAIHAAPNVPTLIVGGSADHVTPLYLFEEDKRFLKNNIKIVEIKEAGHFPWIEQPTCVKNVLESFIKSLII